MGTEQPLAGQRGDQSAPSAPPFVGSALYYGLTILVWAWVIVILVGLGIWIGLLTNAIDNEDVEGGAAARELVARLN